MCGFEGAVRHLTKMARWLSWLERRPVTAEVVGSSPIRVVAFSRLLWYVKYAEFCSFKINVPIWLNWQSS